MIQIERRELPGVGAGYTLHTSEGQLLGVISHRSGRRELLLYSVDDPDDVDRSVALSPAEAQQVAELLHPVTTIDHLTQLGRQSGIAVAGLSVTAGSPYDGRRLGDAVTGTGATAIAIIREEQTISRPDAGQVLAGGDILITAGTHGAIGALSDRLAADPA